MSDTKEDNLAIEDLQIKKRIRTDEGVSQNPIERPQKPINPPQEVIKHLNDNINIYKKGSQFALGDAAHDFKMVRTDILDKNKDILLRGLPDGNGIPANFNFLTEEHIVDSIIMPPLSELYDKNFQEMLYKITNTTSKNLLPSQIQIDAGDNNINTYSACSFNIKEIKRGSPAIVENDEKGVDDPDDFAKNFIENTNLFGNTNECVFVIDFSQHGFLEKLAKGTAVEGKKIYCVNTPEVVNDPAGKPNSQDNTYFHPEISTGVTLVPLIQTDPENMNYNSWNSELNSKSYNDFFISRYNLSLSPIQQDFSSKSHTLYTNLGINYNNFKTSINNSKKENSITTILGHLQTLKDKLSQNPDNQFKFNAKIQQKRGGDWFQVLCCLDIKNRTFTNLLDRKTAEINKDSPVYFVTHDRIAVAYALLVGVNVIYLDYYGKIGVFKNNLDPSTSFNAEIAYNNLRNDYDNLSKDLTLFTNWTTNQYITQRNTFIQEINTKIRETLNKLIENLDRISSTEQLIALFNKPDDNNIIVLFQHLTQFAYLLVNFPDLKGNVEEIGKFKPNTDKKIDYTSELDKLQAIMNKINTIKFVYEKYEKSIKNGVGDPTISDYIDFNCKKINVYKAIDKFNQVGEAVEKEVKEKNKGFTERLIDISSPSKKENKVDRFIFLPYISLLTNNTNRKLFQYYQQFIQFFNKCKSIIITDDAKTKDGIFKKIMARVSRSGRQPVSIISANITCNFIYETLCILNNNEESSKSEYSEEKIEFPESSSSETPPSETPPSETSSSETSSSETSSPGDSILTPDVMRDVNDSTGELNKILTESDNNLSSDKIVIADLINIIKEPLKEEEEEAEEVEEVKKEKHSSVFDRIQIISKLASINLTQNPSGDILKRLKNFVAKRNYLVHERERDQIPDPKYKIEEQVTNLNMAIDLLNNFDLGRETKIGEEAKEEEEKKAKEEEAEKETKGGKMTPPNSSEDKSSDKISPLTISQNSKYDKKTTSSTEKTDLSAFQQLKNSTFHPLYPIFIIAYSFYFNLGSKYENFCFIDNYLKFFKALKKIHTVLVNNYLSKRPEPEFIMAYLLGYGLRSMLFTANTNELVHQSLIDSLQIDKNILTTFLMPCDALSTSFCGAFLYNKEEQMLMVKFIDNKLFKNFIIEEVGLNEILINPLEEDISKPENINIAAIKNSVMDFLNRVQSDMTKYYDIEKPIIQKDDTFSLTDEEPIKAPVEEDEEDEEERIKSEEAKSKPWRKFRRSEETEDPIKAAITAQSKGQGEGLKIQTGREISSTPSTSSSEIDPVRGGNKKYTRKRHHQKCKRKTRKKRKGNKKKTVKTRKGNKKKTVKKRKRNNKKKTRKK